jgi:protein O-GlcNAc transferase
MNAIVPRKTVLHLGCGSTPLPAGFPREQWHEIRCAIDPAVELDLVGNTHELARIADASADAIFSSHSLERLPAHQVPRALAEYLRVLRPGGVASILVTDVQGLAQCIAGGDLDAELYRTPAGPVAVVDLLWGERASLAAGQQHLAQRTGFSAATLEHHLAAAGFASVRVEHRPQTFEMLATATRPTAPATLAELFEQGRVHHTEGRWAAAEARYRQALAVDPAHWPARFELGIVCQLQGRLDEAIAQLQQVVAQEPRFARAQSALGAFLGMAGRPQEALLHLQRAAELEPNSAETHYNLGRAWQEQGEITAAERAYRESLRLDPNNAAGFNSLGVMLAGDRRSGDAVACYRRALDLKPDFPEALSNLAGAVTHHGRFDEAESLYRRALALKPDFAAGYNNLASALKYQGRMDEAIAAVKEAIALDPGYVDAHSNLLCYRQYLPGVTAAELAAAHDEWDRQFGMPLRATWRPHANRRDPERPLRVGFVSADFFKHPVGYFLIRAFEAIDRALYPTIAYSNRQHADDLNARFKAAAGLWREVRHLSDDALAEQIRIDEVDILIDLAGHTAYNRLPVFARKPAPIQITWIGYEGGTGLGAMDYLLADDHLIPPGTQEHCSVLRLPDSYLCYDPPAEAPPVSPPPAEKNGYVTFGSFNNQVKVNPQVVAVWAEILKRLPTSRLVLKYMGLNDTGTRKRYAEMFASHGIAADRLDLLGWSPAAEMLGEYRRVDIALDPFPFVGGATTCHALWMGVPVLTWPGETFAGRHSLSFLTSLGLTQTVAKDRQHYVALAAELANDVPRLARWRQEMRQRMLGSVLCDGPRLARHLETALRRVWRKWCQNENR